MVNAMNVVYIKSEPNLWTVGFYDPAGKWWPDSDHSSPELAAGRMAYLNGAAYRQQRDELAEALKEIALTSSGSLCFQSNCSIDNPLCGQMIARAALASIKEAE